MKPPVFDYVRPASLEAAVAALAAAGGDGKILAGGQSLMPMLNFRLLRPSILVDINRLPGIAGIAERGDAIAVGALTRHHALEMSSLVARHLPVLAAAMKHVAHLAIRNRGTIGGSLSHADPAAELPAMAVLLDAEIATLRGAGARSVPARDFFTGPLATCLGEDEIVTEVVFQKMPPDAGWSFEEFARRAGDFALAGVGVVLGRRGDEIHDLRIVMLGVADTPLRATTAETMLRQRGFTPDAVADAIDAIQAAATPMSDLHASADYRRHLLGVLAERTLAAAFERAAGGR